MRKAYIWGGIILTIAVIGITLAAVLVKSSNDILDPDTFTWTWEDETDLEKYINTDDGAYSYFISQKSEQNGYAYYCVNMTSQNWTLYDDQMYAYDENNIRIDRSLWWHTIKIFAPLQKVEARSDTAIMLIDGGSNAQSYKLDNNCELDELDKAFGRIAAKTGVLGAIAKNIPNEPIYFQSDLDAGNEQRRMEDSIIAKTWRHFLEKNEGLSESSFEDNKWLLRYPMTKAAVKAMDTVTDIARVYHNITDIPNFTVGGASKRGWTTWMTAAVDKRVKAIYPMVMDMLNLNDQLHNVYKSLGGWTFAFGSYYTENITSYVDSPQLTLMQKQVDPYFYRDRLDMPKLVINAAGDEFFLVDDSHQYRKGMQEPYYVAMYPNREHGTIEISAPSILNSVVSMTLANRDDLPLPEISWEYGEDSGNGFISMQLQSDNVWQLDKIKLWHASTNGLTDGRRDFRLFNAGNGTGEELQKVIWKSESLKFSKDGFYNQTMKFPPQGEYSAMFLQATFKSIYDYKFIATSETTIFPDKYPFEDCTGAACYGVLV